MEWLYIAIISYLCFERYLQHRERMKEIENQKWLAVDDEYKRLTSEE